MWAFLVQDETMQSTDMKPTDMGYTPFDEQIKKEFVKRFDGWNECRQNEMVEQLLSKMSHYQHSQINLYLKPMLQRDFISFLPGN